MSPAFRYVVEYGGIVESESEASAYDDAIEDARERWPVNVEVEPVEEVGEGE